MKPEMVDFLFEWLIEYGTARREWVWQEWDTPMWAAWHECANKGYVVASNRLTEKGIEFLKEQAGERISD